MPDGQVPQGQLPQGQQMPPQGPPQPGYTPAPEWRAAQGQAGPTTFEARPGSNVFQGNPAYAAGGQPAPTVVVNVPKQSRAPLVILIILLAALLILPLIGFVSCSRMASSFAAGMTDESPYTVSDTVAVIHVEGTIMSSGAGYVTPEIILSELQAAESDDNVVAIVLRIDSGGGSAAAGEEIATYVRECDKPVIVSCGDSCASAAYRIASQADWIIASDGTTVGSIGTIIAKYDLTGLIDELGIDVDMIASGENKADLDYFSTLTPEQREYYQQMVNEITEGFIDDVAEGRGLDRETVAELATGDIWTGSKALEYGLIDQVGTYEDALDVAAHMGGCEEYDVVSFDMYTSYSLASLI